MCPLNAEMNRAFFLSTQLLKLLRRAELQAEEMGSIFAEDSQDLDLEEQQLHSEDSIFWQPRDWGTWFFKRRSGWIIGVRYGVSWLPTAEAEVVSSGYASHDAVDTGCPALQTFCEPTSVPRIFLTFVF